MTNKIENWIDGAPEKDGLYVFMVKYKNIDEAFYFELARVEDGDYMAIGCSDWQSLDDPLIIKHAELDL